MMRISFMLSKSEGGWCSVEAYGDMNDVLNVLESIKKLVKRSGYKIE